MSWKAYEFENKKQIGEYPDEMAMSLWLREHYRPGARFVVENDDGAQFEAVRDAHVVKIILSPSLSEIENEELHDDENYSPYPES